VFTNRIAPALHKSTPFVLYAGLYGSTTAVNWLRACRVERRLRCCRGHVSGRWQLLLAFAGHRLLLVMMMKGAL
jgi:hypothetical protein